MSARDGTYPRQRTGGDTHGRPGGAPLRTEPQGALSLASPLPARLLAWMHERFPLGNAVFFGALYLAAALYGRAVAGQPPRLAAADVAGFLAAWAFFLMLRVLDEHKDYADDARNHPGRVLQRGLVTLRQLAGVGLIAAAAQLAISLSFDGGTRGVPGPTTLLWLATLAWSLLMAREFFVGAWLRPRLLLYATSHMLVMPLAVLWMAQMGAAGAPLTAEALRIAPLAFLSGFGFEVARKTRAPADERPGVDSYTRRLGTGGAALTLLGLLAGTGAAVLWALATPVVGAALHSGTGAPLPSGAVAAVVLTVAVAAVPLLRFRAHPTPRSAAQVEVAVGLAMLLCYAVLIAALLAVEVAPW